MILYQAIGEKPQDHRYNRVSDFWISTAQLPCGYCPQSQPDETRHRWARLGRLKSLEGIRVGSQNETQYDWIEDVLSEQQVQRQGA